MLEKKRFKPPLKALAFSKFLLEMFYAQLLSHLLKKFEFTELCF